jgi:hypothetical protein
MTMDTGAAVSVKLADHIPAPSQLTDVTGQLKALIGGVHVPDMPLADIQKLTAGLDLNIPDTSTWQTAIPMDVNSLLRDFPSPESLARPLGAPLASLTDLVGFDFMGQAARLQAQLQAATGSAADSPDALLASLTTPLDLVTRFLNDPSLTALFTELAALLGIDDLRTVPHNLTASTAAIETVVRDRVENIILAVIAISQVLTATTRAELLVTTASGAFSMDGTSARFRDLLAHYGAGTDSLAEQLRALNPADEAQRSALQGRFQATADSFAAFIGSLSRDLAFTEASLVLISSADLGGKFSALGTAVSKIDANKISGVATLIEAPLRQAANAVKFPDDYSIDAYKMHIHNGLALATSEVEKLDSARLTEVLRKLLDTIDAPFKKLKDFETEVETVVRGALQSVRDAVQKIDLRPLRGQIDDVLNRLESSLHDLDSALSNVRSAIQGALGGAKTALDSAREAILDPQHGLQKQLEDVFNTLNQVLQQLNIKAAIDEVSAVLQPITAALGTFEFAPVFSATVGALDTVTSTINSVGPLLVTEDLKKKLSDVTDFLRQVKIDEIGTKLTDAFDEVLKGVDEQSLGSFKAKYQTIIEGIDQIDPVPVLAQLQKEVFDPLVAELEKIKPAELLKPLADGYQAAVSELERFKPAQTLKFLTDFFDQLVAQLHSISPDALLQPIKTALDDLRNRITSALRLDLLLDAIDKAREFLTPIIDTLDFGPLIEQMIAGHQSMRAAVASFDPGEGFNPVSRIIGDLLAPTGADVLPAGVLGAVNAVASQPADLTNRLTAMQTALQSVQTQIDGIDANGWLATLRVRHTDLSAALSVQAGAGSLSVQVGLLDPVVALAPLLPKIDRLKGVCADSVAQFSVAVQTAAPVLGAINAVCDALRTLLSQLKLLQQIFLEPLRRLLPRQPAGGARELILAFLDQLDPAQFRTEFATLFTTLHTKLKALLDDAVLNPIADTIQTIKSTVDLLNITDLTDAIQAVFSDVDSVVQQFNPRPIVQAIDDRYQQILALLHKLDPSEFISQIDKMYTDDVLGVVIAISPNTLLLPPLQKLFGSIRGTLAALDVESLFQPVLDRLRILEGQLEDGLSRTEASYAAMIDALDAATGVGSVSVSASATLGAGGTA